METNFKKSEKFEKLDVRVESMETGRNDIVGKHLATGLIN